MRFLRTIHLTCYLDVGTVSPIQAKRICGIIFYVHYLVLLFNPKWNWSRLGWLLLLNPIECVSETHDWLRMLPLMRLDLHKFAPFRRHVLAYIQLEFCCWLYTAKSSNQGRTTQRSLYAHLLWLQWHHNTNCSDIICEWPTLVRLLCVCGAIY